MSEEKAIKLIHKYFHDEGLTERELKELLDWLKTPENKKILEEQIGLDYEFRKTDKKFDVAEAYRRIENQLQPTKKGYKSWVPLLKYAAVLIIALGVGFYLFTSNVRNSTASNSTSITLEMGAGNTRILQQQGQEIIVNNKGQEIGIRTENNLTYNRDTTATELVYNTLYIPKGKTFELQLSDGTQILLNADTKITYPVNFLPDEERIIRLRGEAYFQVAKDSLRPFIAQTSNQKVQVYGTTFNIKAYPEDLFDETVLIEGSVGITTTESEVKIVPGQRATTRRGREPEVEEVNTADYTAWIQGGMVFHADRFDKIIKVLERRFDIKIDNKYEQLNQERFTASFKKPEDIEQILNLFIKSRTFEYEREGKHMTIYKPE